MKHRSTLDCVVGGYRLSKTLDGIGALLLGLYDDDATLHYVGHTSSFKAKERRDMLGELRVLEGGESFEGGRAPGGPSRWSAGKDTAWVALQPILVCEVTIDRMQVRPVPPRRHVRALARRSRAPLVHVRTASRRGAARLAGGRLALFDVRLAVGGRRSRG